ncbi:MAG: FAD-binding oxidoreductase [Actinomycetota bacterium]|nr:FAD-binding oxidoreductase [Actinomycetota bacterium]
MTARRQLTFAAPPPLPDHKFSLWLDQAGAFEDAAPPGAASLPPACDVCVVGGGFTGLWSAIQLKREDPAAEVVLLEAGICGGEASGRNGGFVMTAWSKFGTLSQLCGTDGALAYGRAAERAVSEIGEFCEAEGIDAEFRQAGWIWAASNTGQLDSWKYTVEELNAAGVDPFQPLTAEEVAARTGSPVHVGGVYEEAPATIHPAKLARGLMKAARDLGVEIIEGCAVRSIDPGPETVVGTEKGNLEAGKVILAMSAWASGVPEARRGLIVVSSDVVATAPVPDRLEKIGWNDGTAISDSRRMVNYYRTTEDGRVVFGKGGGDIAYRNRVTRDFDRSTRRAPTVTASFRRIYPMLADVPVESAWRGAVDYSVTGLPFIGPLKDCPQVLMASGFSGNGVGPAYVAGKGLARMALGRDAPDIPPGLREPRDGRLPPEPLRHIAGLVVRNAVRSKEDAEDLGREPRNLLQRVAAVDPTSFVERG